ncbi:hypothetical protein Q8A67_008471 [Cirrhinus molitorella]|uniref:AIG1-type G domain-containing protein n=1 Tax=Cirrhinus molitorella TaxID=172907 RepID=A0AA88PX56_9TELE|nr:hypothetical protein Q8A67_008471 [Cirrhinus molitorella]
MKENRHFTCQIHEVMEEATKIMERRMLDNLKNIKKEVRKMADVRRAVFMAEINEEKQEMERKRKQIQHRIDRIEADIKKEEKNVQTIPERLRRYKATLKREQENLRKLEERRMEEERERNTRKEKEDKDLNIWIREEEERRLSAAGQKKQHSSPFNKETALFILLKGESIREFISRQNAKIQGLVGRFGRRFVAFDNTNPTNQNQVRRLLRKVDELLAVNENRHFTNEVTQVMQAAQKIIEERMQAEVDKRMKKIRKEVKKMADVRWQAFISDSNEKRRKTRRKLKRLQGRIDRLEMDIPARLEEFEASLKMQLKNMRRLQKRQLKKERKRMERKEKEKEIWILEEMQRRLSEATEKSLFSSHNILAMLTSFSLGLGSSYVPTLYAFLFPAAPAVETGLASKFLYNLLHIGAAESESYIAKAAGVAMKAVSVKLASMTNCCIQ